MAFTADDYFKQKAEKEATQKATREKNAALKQQVTISNQVVNKDGSVSTVSSKSRTSEEQKQVKNIFGATQGKSPEQPATIPTEAPPVPQTTKMRAESAVTNIQTREALPTSTRVIPKNVNVSISKGGQNNNASIPKSNIGGPSSDTTGKLANEEAKRQQNIENLLAREKRLSESKQQLFLNLGLIKTPQQEQFNLLNPKETVIGIGKSIAQFPFNLASMPVELGGRGGFAIESLTYSEGREELIRAGKETPKAVISSFNPTTTEGIVNIGLTTLAIKGTAKGIMTAREPIKFSAEEAGTLRISGEESVRDITSVKIKAFQGKTPIEVAGKGVKEFFQKSETESLTVGSGQIGKIKFETRGTAIKTEPQYSSDLGGYKAVDIIKTTKGKYYLDVAESATLAEKPFMSMKTLSRTLELPKNKPVTEGKPMSISAGTTGEIYIEDIFNSQKNILRKEVVSESGQVKTEQYLGTSRFSVSAKTFEEQFKTERASTPQEFTISKAEFVKEFKPETNIEGTILKQQLETKGLPTQGDLLLKMARQEAESQSFRLKTAQVSREASSSLAQVSGTSLMQKVETKQTTKPVILSKPTQKISTGPMFTRIQEVSIKQISKPTQQVKPVSITEVISRPVQVTKNIPVIETVITPPPVLPVTTITNIPSSNIPTSFLLPPPMGLDLNLGRGTPSKKIKSPKYGYLPSIEAEIFNIRGKKTKGWESGLVGRPL